MSILIKESSTAFFYFELMFEFGLGLAIHYCIKTWNFHDGLFLELEIWFHSLWPL